MKRILYNWHTDESRNFDIRLGHELELHGFNIEFIPLKISKTRYRLIIKVNDNKYYINEYDDLSDKTFNKVLSEVICLFKKSEILN